MWLTHTPTRRFLRWPNEFYWVQLLTLMIAKVHILQDSIYSTHIYELNSFSPVKLSSVKYKTRFSKLSSVQFSSVQSTDERLSVFFNQYKLKIRVWVQCPSSLLSKQWARFEKLGIRLKFKLFRLDWNSANSEFHIQC